MNTTLFDLTKRIRHDILTITTTANSGHPSSSLSAVEIMTVLFFAHLRYDMKDPKNPNNDRVIFSKGHASPLYYALYAAAGVISPEELLGYRTFDSVLEGHPTERFAYTEAATGSLGQGLSIGLGEALALKMQHDRVNASTHQASDASTLSDASTPSDASTQYYCPRVFVLCGDGEIAEGSVWEAAAAASHKKVDNLYLFVDVNRLGQSDPTMYGHDVEVYAKRFEAFGWRVVVIEDGNALDAVVDAIDATFKGSTFTGMPTVFLAKTKKGAGISFIEDKDGWHGKPLSKEELTKALSELGEVDTSLIGAVRSPGVNASTHQGSDASTPPDAMTLYDKPTATRKAFGNALLRLGKIDTTLVAIDGDTKNSTYIDAFGKAYPDRFVELFIAEQNMLGVAVGFSARGYHPVVASFACFFSRAADQIRMAAFSGSNIIVDGSHAGVSIGEDGPSQMGLEDLSLFRSVHGSTVLYPSDAMSTEKLVELAVQQKGIVYMRTSRPETAILYGVDEVFQIGGSKTFDASTPTDASTSLVTIISAGITLHEALKAQKALEAEGIAVCVIDCYSVKPIDTKTLRAFNEKSKAMIVVEDHYPEGGLGEAVKSALALSPGAPIYHMSVTKTPRSGKAAQLLAYEEIDCEAIIQKVRSCLG